MPGGRIGQQTLTIQVDPAAPVSFDKLWNGPDTNWYNPANWSPAGVPTAVHRVYVSAATTVIPRLTANVTIRDLFLEPGATLDTNGFVLTVTNTADAGRTVIGAGQHGADRDGRHGERRVLEPGDRGRITLTAPLTTTGSLTLAAGARLELNGQPLHGRRPADHQRHRRRAPGDPRDRQQLVRGDRRERQWPGAHRDAADDQRAGR